MIATLETTTLPGPTPSADPTPTPSAGPTPSPAPSPTPSPTPGPTLPHPSWVSSPRPPSPIAPAAADADRELRALGPVAALLRAPAEVARRALEDDGARELARTSLGALVLGGTLFGGVIGAFRGGAQIASAAVKMPLVVALALALAVPAFHGLSLALGRRQSLRATATLALASAGRAGLVLTAIAPLLWLAIDLGLGYHASALAATVAFGVAGLAALAVQWRGIGDGPGKGALALAMAVVLLAIGGQTGWMMRPFLVRPRTDDVPFVRSTEGSFVDAVVTTGRSAAGFYRSVGSGSYDGAEPEWLEPQRSASDLEWVEPTRAESYSRGGSP